MPLAIIRAEQVSKRYRLGAFGASTLREEAERLYRRVIRSTPPEDLSGRGSDDEFWALRDVSFAVQPGEVVGLIGRNGAGKSTLLKILSRITEPTTGQVRLRGRVASLLEIGTGFHPELSGRENIYLNGTILGMTKAEVKAKFDEIVAFAEIDRFLETPVKRYSSGMYVRLAFAVAAHLEQEILIVDEVLAVGDAAFQRKCLGKISDVAKQQGRTVLFVSHNIAAVLNLCSKAMLVQGGRAGQIGDVESVVQQYMRSLRDVSSTSLLGRSDRRGTGLLRFSNIGFRTPSGRELGVVKCGDDVMVAIEFRILGQRDPGDVRLSLSIRDTHDNVISHLGTDIQSDDFALGDAKREHSVGVNIKRLQLAPGTYSLSLSVWAGGDLADAVDSAALLEVHPGDYYGTGRLPLESQGSFLMDYSFVVDGQAALPTTGGGSVRREAAASVPTT